MSRKCRPGIRARIIRGTNAGKIVVVVRRYFGEKLNDATWPMAMFPWVVTSLAGPLRAFRVETRVEVPPASTIVLDDCDLEPLKDDDPELETDVGLSTHTRRGGIAESAVRQAPHRVLQGDCHE